MPIVLSKDHKYRGTYTQRLKVWDAMKALFAFEQGLSLDPKHVKDSDFEDSFLIRTDQGRIKVDGVKFCRLSYAAMCRELQKQSRIAVHPSNTTGNPADAIFSVWVSPVNEIYFSATEQREMEDEENGN